MKPRLLLATLVLLAALPARAQAPAIDPAAVAACEAAVAETVRDLRGSAAAQGLRFTAARAGAPQTAADETALRGEGRYRAAGGATRPFTYSCVFDAKTAKTSGVVFQEADAAPAATTIAREPDLTHVSPPACENAAAAALTARYAHAGRIRFDSSTRRLQPAPNDGTRLDGRGTIERAAGLNPIGFTYRCEFEARSGKLLAVETGD